jgi:general secretion pathway protein G
MISVQTGGNMQIISTHNQTTNVTQSRRSLTNQRGMTLIEIMIVLAIIGGLMALLAPRFTGAQDKAKVRETKISMGQVINALNMYYTDCGKFPSNLDALVKAPGDECQNWGPEAYIKKEPKDSWGNAYVYSIDGSNFIIKSFGKDGREGGSGFDKDINSDEL